MSIWRQFWISPDAHAVSAHTLAQAQALPRAQAAAPTLRLLHAVCITPAQTPTHTPVSHSRQSLHGGQLLLSHYGGPLDSVLREIGGLADEIVLDARCLPSGPNPHTARALARCCRPGTRLQISGQATHHQPLADALKPAGFMQPDATACAAQTWVYSPHWPPRTAAQRAARAATAPGRCLVLGAGLAGAAVAASLARRGWQVCVLDAQGPASGASGVPVGLLAPHTSKDHSVLSRISQMGVQATWEAANALLVQGVDWQQSGVSQRNPTTPEQAPQWHASGGWIKPARLVQTWLAQPGIAVQPNCPVARLAAPDSANADWRALDTSGQLLASAGLVVLAAGAASAALVQTALAALPGTAPALQAIRGQLSWGHYEPGSRLHALLPATAVNGHGSLIPAVPSGLSLGSGSATGLLWLSGATYQRDDTDLSPRLADQAANLARLPVLLPETGAALAAHLTGRAGSAGAGVQDWVGVRCASIDRLPLVGPWPAAAAANADAAPTLWLCTALGSRGLSYAALCGELLAARLHQEPLPLPASLARCLDAGRHQKLLLK